MDWTLRARFWRWFTAPYLGALPFSFIGTTLHTRGTPLVSSRLQSSLSFIKVKNNGLTQPVYLVITVHTNILPLDHQAKLISSLFNKMAYQDKSITIVNHIPLNPVAIVHHLISNELL